MPRNPTKPHSLPYPAPAAGQAEGRPDIPRGDLTRRAVLAGGLRLGLWGALMGLGAGVLARGAAAQAPDHYFTPAQREVFAAVSTVLLGGMLPVAGPDRETARAEVLRDADTFMSRMPLHIQAEARQALDLLALAPVRILVAGIWPRWDRAAGEDVAEFLENFRTSRFGLKRRIYQFLHELSALAWFGNPRAWPAMGYPGPPQVQRPPRQEWS